jgi:hypothetical protein
MIDAGEQSGIFTPEDAEQWKRRMYIAVSSEGQRQRVGPEIESGTLPTTYSRLPATYQYVSTYVFTPPTTVDGYLCIAIEAFSEFFALRWIALDRDSSESRELRVHMDGVEHESVLASGSTIAGGAVRGETLFVPPIATGNRELALRLVGADGRIRHSIVREP